MKTDWRLDLTLGVRMLIKHPGLALIGGFGIAVGVAIAAGAFSVIYGNFLASSIPLDRGGRLVSIEMWDASANKPEGRILHDYRIWRQELKSIAEIGAFRTVMATLIAPGQRPEPVRIASITASGFRIARVGPLLGRYLTEEDERDGAPDVVVIGAPVWRNHFASDPAILGRTIQLGAKAHAVVGVMPETFAFPVNHRFWTPLRGHALQPLTGPGAMVFGRLAPGATLDTAQAELTAIGQRAAAASPKLYSQLRPRAMPYAYPFLGLHESKDVTGLHAMQGIVASVLALVCLNVAILVYARTATRQTEIAVRVALGASRRRIVAQLFLEALVLSGIAAAAGVGIAALALRQTAISASHVAPDLPFWMSFRLSPEAVLYSVGLAVAAAGIVGILPALQATRRGVYAGLGARGTGGPRLGMTWTVLVIAQVGFVVAILPSAVSNAWGDLRDGFAGPGFPAEEFLSVHLVADQDERRSASKQAELIRRLEAEPPVSRVTFSMAVPGDEPGAHVYVERGSAEGSALSVRFNRVAPDFFATFDVPILTGRGFRSSDVAHTSGPVVVNEAFARRVFGGDALGRRIRYVSDGERWHEIVGVVGDFPSGVSAGMHDAALKVYHLAEDRQALPATLAIRVRGQPSARFAERLREIAAALDPGLTLSSVISLDEALRRDQWIWRLQSAVVAAVTLSVLLLSAVGIYALMSFAVSRRRKEIGIRAALGADRIRLVWGVFSRALAQLGFGAVLGTLAGALLESRLGLIREDGPTVLPVVLILVIATGLLAALGPVRRSLKIEPTEALREQ